MWLSEELRDVIASKWSLGSNSGAAEGLSRQRAELRPRSALDARWCCRVHGMVTVWGPHGNRSWGLLSGARSWDGHMAGGKKSVFPVILKLKWRKYRDGRG